MRLEATDRTLATCSGLRRAVLPLCLVWAMAVPALLLLWPAGYFYAHDAVFHLYRTYELDLLLRQGELWPRWQPDFAFGYGYPLFNFYSPLVYYVAEGLHLAGLGLVDALKATAALATLLGAAGTYLLGRRWLGTPSGVLAALAYVYWPYAFFDLYVRWALAEFFAIGLLPLALWLADKALAGEGHPRVWVVAGAALVAMLVLTHSPTALLFLPVLAAYVVVVAWSHSQGRAVSREGLPQALAVLSRGGLIVGLGLGLAAFFWLPAWRDHSFVQLTEEPQFYEGLTEPGQLVQLAFAYDYEQYRHLDGRFLPVGAVQIALAVVALPALRRLRWARGRLLFLCGLVVYCGLAVLQFTAPIWHAVPLASLMTFPWRLQILVGLATALLAGAAVSWLGGRARWVAAAALFALAVSSSLAGVRPVREVLPDSLVSLAAYLRYEATKGVTGSTAPGRQFMPRWVQVEPIALAQPEASGRAASRATAEVVLDGYSPSRVHLRTAARQPAVLLWRNFYFPGWTAYLDERPVELRPAGDGVIALDLPPGEHRLVVQWEGTRAQRAGEVVSLASAIALALLLAWPARRAAGGSWKPLALLAVAVALSGAIYWLRPQAPAVSQVDATFAEELALRGWQVNYDDVGRRAALQVQLYWYTLAAPLPDYQVSLRLVDAEGRVRARHEKAPFFGTAPMSRWQAGQLVRDRQDIYLPADLAPGEYFLEVGLRDAADAHLLTLTAGVPGVERGATYARLGPVQIREVRPGPVYHPQKARQDDLGWQVRLLGFDLGGDDGKKVVAAEPGGRLAISFYWQALDQLPEDYAVFVHLAGPSGKVVAQRDRVGGADLLPPTRWEPMRPLQDRTELVIPPATPAGLYWLSAGLYNRGNMRNLSLLDQEGRPAGDRVVLSPVKVLGPPPRPPSMEASAGYGGLLRLVGYDVKGREEAGGVVAATPGEPLRLRLHWRAEAEIGEDYTTFVHLADGHGKVLAQRDSQPWANTYPTSLWEVGEVVVDELELPVGSQVPAGEYRIVVGWYLAATGQRLPLDGRPEDHVVLGPPVVVRP